MKTVSSIYPKEKKVLYQLLKVRIQGLIDGVPYLIANLANVKNGRLVLGPFQGRPACVEIPMGKGVCGTAAAKDESILVENVHEFPGHIACDCASKSEIVIPIHKNGEIVGVLDIDSPSFGRFDEEDKDGLLRVTAVLEKKWNEGLY